jgi:hypothetical protein
MERLGMLIEDSECWADFFTKGMKLSSLVWALNVHYDAYWGNELSLRCRLLTNFVNFYRISSRFLINISISLDSSDQAQPRIRGVKPVLFLLIFKFIEFNDP